MRSPRPAARIIAFIHTTNGAPFSISTNTCNNFGKPLKQCSAYAIVRLSFSRISCSPQAADTSSRSGSSSLWRRKRSPKIFA
jgi:hypothetical protein